MKKILGAVTALALLGSAVFAEVSVSGQAEVDLKAFTYDKGTEETTLFDQWNLEDTDIWVKGVFADGRAGGQINITGPADPKSESMIALGDWDLWVKPLDFLTIKASNYANRSMDRYVGILDKLGEGYGVLKLTGTGIGFYEAERLTGLMTIFDFGAAQFEAAVSATEADNTMDFTSPAIRLGDTVDAGAGVRLSVPVEGLMKAVALYKVDKKDDGLSTNYLRNIFGAYVDISAVSNLNVVLGYTGDYTTHDKLAGDYSENYNGIDLRVQYLADKLGLVLHNNATFGTGTVAEADLLGIKTRFGLSYAVNDDLTAVLETQNLFGKIDSGLSTHTFDQVTLYPRVVVQLHSNVALGTGLTCVFDVVNKTTMGNVTVNNDKAMNIAMPLSLTVSF